MIPAALVTMSPGLIARPLGMFSQVGTRPTTLSGRPSSATTDIVAMTAAAPDMSNFISSIAPGSLREMPPVSKVIPFPTSTIGARGPRGALYSMTMNLGG